MEITWIVSLPGTWYSTALADIPAFALSDIADHALYETKHNGGNQVVLVET